MCGVTGLAWVGDGAPPAGLRAGAVAMADRIAHRGPDAAGAWASADGRVALGHRRLAIIDLSAAGLQPMRSANGRYTIAYNGEVTNFESLRPELVARGVAFRGHSDTEVMLEWIAAFGLDSLLQRIEGMFAFALHDGADGAITLVRDRFGVKPLFWRLEAGTIAFASELTAFRALPGVSPRIDRGALAAYLRHGHVPAPWTIFHGCHAVQPGHAVRIDARGRVGIHPWWTPAPATAPLADDLSDAALIALVDQELVRCIRQEMVADVPLGSFLSGGIDSSLVTAIMQEASERPIRTFGISFAEAGFDEGSHAMAVAKAIGTTHTDIPFGAREALDLLPAFAAHSDQPLADMAMLPTLLLSRVARTELTVAMSGDGGDEFFSGYERYRQWSALEARLGVLPRPMRAGAAGLIRALPGGALAGAGAAMGRPRLATQALRLAEIMDADDALDRYRRLLSHWPDPGQLVPGATEHHPPIWAGVGLAGFAPNLMPQILDIAHYLPNMVLTKMDRASMAASLEVRVPLLNHRLLDLALRLPERARRRGESGKWVLREALYRRVPRALVDRPKQGFGVPMGAWLRGPLRDWAEPLLCDAALADSGIAAAPVRARWTAHIGGRVDWSYPLFTVLAYQHWRRTHRV
jgi:asparagine synthase (glutamine-hydrolysing)